MTKELFQIKIAFMSKLFGKLVDNDVYKMLWSLLKKYSDDQFSAMVEGLIASFKPTSQIPFPLPVHFLECLGMDANSKAIQAVGIVKASQNNPGPYCSVSFGDRALHATIKRFGGWIEICQWSDKDWSFNEKKFIEAYKSEIHFNNGPDKLTGITEEGFIDTKHLLNETQLLICEEQSKPVKINWPGAGTLLENKSGVDPSQKLIEGLSNKLSIDKS